MAVSNCRDHRHLATTQRPRHRHRRLLFFDGVHLSHRRVLAVCQLRLYWEGSEGDVGVSSNDEHFSDAEIHRVVSGALIGRDVALRDDVALRENVAVGWRGSLGCVRTSARRKMSGYVVRLVSGFVGGWKGGWMVG
jgi:hypothetical protein